MSTLNTRGDQVEAMRRARGRPRDPAETRPLITSTISGFCQLAGIGRTKTYQLIAAGDLDTVLVGRRHLVVLESYHRMIEAQLTAKRAAG